jgi:hypothetical protein
MAKENETQQQEQQVVIPSQQPRPCPQDCSKCSMPQQVYCTSKMLFDLSRSYQEQRQQTAELAKAVVTIQEQLRTASSGAQLSIPFSSQEE